ncbi:MAG: hypothetical protein LBN29_12340, partial [Mediterranea sp.]|nr:hypothetical protein [Mediterranea sp.]
DVTYQDQVITLTGPTSFENGKEYTVNSRITKRLTWATSNIYWDGAKLTFDADAANGGVAKGVPSVTTANSPYYQGVFFKWGSLVGIAPVGDAAAFSNTTVVYKPNTPTSAGYSSGYTSTTIASGVWGEILMFIPPSAPGSGNYFLPHKAVLDQGTYFGDICAYITGGVWRIPTSVETTSYYGGYCYRNEPAVGWWIPNMPENGASWSSITVPNNSDSRAGKYSFVARPDNVFRLKTRWGQVVSLPPGGSRTMNNLQSPGRSGNYLFGNSRYLSSRTYSYTTFNGIGADNSAYMASQPFSQNGNAYAVRCVK